MSEQYKAWTRGVTGLTMTVNVQQYEYVKQAGDTAGIIAVILPQYQMPFPEDDGTMISPGHATSIGIIQVTRVFVMLFLVFLPLYRLFCLFQFFVSVVSLLLSVYGE